MARPLIEVFSVTYAPDFKKFPPSHRNGDVIQLYGDVFIHEEDDPDQIYKLYERRIEHPQSIKDGECPELLLACPKSHAMSMSRPILNIGLFAKQTTKSSLCSLSLISCQLELDTSTMGDYEKFYKKEVWGWWGSASVMYVSMACALVARVRIKLDERDNDVAQELTRTRSKEDSGKCFPAVGTVVAYYGKTYGDKRTLPWAKMRVLDAPPDESIPVEWHQLPHQQSEISLKLNREFVAVPAYSKLIIQADLRDRYTDEPILQGELDLWPSASTFAIVRCDDSPTLIRRQKAWLFVSWFEPSVLQPSPKVDMSTCITKVGWTYVGSLLEVYSVFIGRDNDTELRIYGKIGIRHRKSRRVASPIYERDCKNADELLGGKKLLSVPGPSKPSELLSCDDYFLILVDLSEASNRFRIDDGSIKFDSDMNKQDELKFDQLLCSVIHGEDGYCAVHYTNFRNAVKLSVEGVVLCRIADGARVYGRIVAWNGMCTYKSEYDKKYYRRVLFEKSEDNMDLLEKVTVESSLDAYRFSTSYVAMPVGYPLFIDIDVYARSHSGRVATEHFQHTLQFELGGKLPMEIGGKNFDILVYVRMISRSEI